MMRKSHADRVRRDGNRVPAPVDPLRVCRVGRAERAPPIGTGGGSRSARPNLPVRPRPSAETRHTSGGQTMTDPATPHPTAPASRLRLAIALFAVATWAGFVSGLAEYGAIAAR